MSREETTGKPDTLSYNEPLARVATLAHTHTATRTSPLYCPGVGSTQLIPPVYCSLTGRYQAWALGYFLRLLCFMNLWTCVCVCMYQIHPELKRYVACFLPLIPVGLALHYHAICGACAWPTGTVTYFWLRSPDVWMCFFCFLFFFFFGWCVENSDQKQCIVNGEMPCRCAIPPTPPKPISSCARNLNYFRPTISDGGCGTANGATFSPRSNSNTKQTPRKKVTPTESSKVL